MCGRFEVDAAAEKLKKRFGLKLPPPMPNMAEQFPTNRILTIDTESGRPRGRLLGWGLAVNWTARPLINARAETLTRKPTFRPLLTRRCLIPATAYFEWRRMDDGTKRKMRLTPKDQDIFAMAGLVGRDGDHATIVTCPPATEIDHIHDRMPVILHPDEEARWLDGAVEFQDVAAALKPYEGGMYTEAA